MTKQKQGQSDRFLDPNTDYLHTAFLHDLNLFKHILRSGCSHPIYILFTSLDLSFHQLSNTIIQTVLLQKLAKIRRKENEKPKTMARFFFKIWIRSNIFCDISGCSRPIFISFLSLDSSFHQRSNAVFQIVLLQKLAKIWRKENEKREA